MKIDSFDRFSKNTELPNFMKIPPVGAEIFLVDGRTDMTKLIVTSRKLCESTQKRPQNPEFMCFTTNFVQKPYYKKKNLPKPEALKLVRRRPYSELRAVQYRNLFYIDFH
jgi:hypothetical protein